MAKADMDVTPIFTKCPIPPDIVAFGLQELDMSANSIIKQETSRAQPWIDHIENQLNYSTKKTLKSLYGENYEMKDEEKYVLIQSKQLCGVLLAIYVRKEHVEHVKDIVTVIRVTGILGMMGNKGGIATRFQIYDSTFCIINSHFNAHQTNVSRRNQDYRDVCSSLFTLPGGNKITIFEHDNLFWMGDLNYRIDLPDEVVREKIKKAQWSHLFHADQLNIQMKAGNVFNGWVEPKINFPPTYKFIPGTNEYDSEKGRIPSWCDRILWRKNKYIENLYYETHEILDSDHRPVSGHFLVAVKEVIKEKRTKVLQEIMQEVDKMQNEMKPNAILSSYELDFGDVLYEVPVTRTVVIENIGKVKCNWRFIPKFDETSPHKEWVSIIPLAGSLMPGETVSISITVNIHKGNIGTIGDIHPLRDIMILQIVGGKDYFVSIGANFVMESVDNDGDIV